jgi:hypothetical protein
MPDRDFKAAGEFAIPFAYAMSALRKAKDAGRGVELSAEEVRAVMEAFRMFAVADSETPNKEKVDE